MLSSGTKIGPYEILAPLGAGGMGVVYRCSDTRLRREVAIKLLPGVASPNCESLKRFQQEARVMAALNHPNILAIYDTGLHENSPYIVSELLEGRTIRERLRSGAIPTRKAIELGIQIARGLAAAHSKGIVHRDLKPENIFLRTDGQIKILDFGLAQLIRSDRVDQSETIAIDPKTSPGTLLGTIGYMAPEQLRGAATDVRSDLFSFGAVLYEMLAGRRAFHGESPADLMSAILKDESPDLTSNDHKIPPALEQIVRHCLEKDPHERFQSAQDVAFDLEQIHAAGKSSSLPIFQSSPSIPIWRSILLAITLLAVAAGSFLLGKRTNRDSSPAFQQVTFQRGRVVRARFSPDGRTIIYSAAWNGGASDVYSTRAERPGARSLDLKGGQLLAVSSLGDVAILVKTHAAGTFADTGTLAIVPLSGGTPHEVLEDVQDVDFSPDGKHLALIRDVGLRSRLEYPAGKSLYEFTGRLSHVRISPGGDSLAFEEHPEYDDTLDHSSSSI